MKPLIAKLLNAGSRPLNLLGAAACSLLFGYALFAEHVQGYEPCPLCILQRVAVIGLGLAFLLAALHHPAGRFRHTYSALCGAIGLAGGGVAARHLWIQAQPEGSVPPCGASFDFILDNFGIVTAVREALTASGECAEVDWSLFGLAMPAWVLLAFLALTAWAVWTNSFARQRPAPLA
ncbi:MAG: disulfide bond formation protein B [Gammaproteobacteria bacterium]|nr:disulfide bond formation protein B [Gammaproteobacteria bacterium]MCY4255984.1 disulfide bond formation protein B [Gammaproteobacteria bacterium]MCY4341090.1 disulfide bond formation protein B [Gammaproteobacteria bacterium]